MQRRKVIHVLQLLESFLMCFGDDHRFSLGASMYDAMGDRLDDVVGLEVLKLL